MYVVDERKALISNTLSWDSTSLVHDVHTLPIALSLSEYLCRTSPQGPHMTTLKIPSLESEKF